MAHLRGLWAHPSPNYFAASSSSLLLNISFSFLSFSPRRRRRLPQMVSEDFFPPFAVSSFALQWDSLPLQRRPQ